MGTLESELVFAEVTWCYPCLGETEQFPHRTAHFLQDYGGTRTPECTHDPAEALSPASASWEWTCAPCWEQQVFT